MTEQEFAKAEELRQRAEDRKTRVKAHLPPREEDKPIEPQHIVLELHEPEAIRTSIKNATLEVEALKMDVVTLTENQNALSLNQDQIMQRLDQMEVGMRDFQKNLKLQIDMIVDLKKDELERIKKTLDKLDKYLNDWV